MRHHLGPLLLIGVIVLTIGSFGGVSVLGALVLLALVLCAGAGAGLWVRR